jgi:hypothetical protein
MANYAIVIGIDSYANERWNLGAAVNDAVSFARWALGPGGVPPENLRLHLSGSERPDDLEAKEADAKTIRETIYEFQKNAGAGGERLYFYYAGHGLSAPGAVSGLAPEPVLIPADAEVLTRDAWMTIPFSGIMPALETCEPRSQLYFIDACRDFGLDEFQPAVGRATGPWRPPGREGENGHEEDGLARQYVLYAAAPGQRANEKQLLQKGIFSTALIEALEGNPAAAIWKHDHFEVCFTGIAEYVRRTVKSRVQRQKDWERYIQVPEPLAIRGTDEVLSVISREQMGKLPLRVRLSPAAARKTCKIQVLERTAAMPDGMEVCAAGPPAKQTNKFEVPPGDYAVRALAESYEPYDKPCPVYEPAEVPVTLHPSERVEPEEAAAGGNGGLVLTCEDPTALIVVRDQQRQPRGSGWKRLELDELPPGLYRVQLVTSEGAMEEQVFQVLPGPPAEHELTPPGAQVGEDQLGMLKKLGIEEAGGYLHPSEHLDAFANARFGSLLGFAAFAAHWPDIGDFQRLRAFGVRSMEEVRKRKGKAGLLVLLGASGDSPVPDTTRDQFLDQAEYLARDLGGLTVAQGKFEPLSGMPAAAQASAEIETGSLMLELRLPGLAPTRYALAALEHRVTVLVAVAEDSGEVEVQQYLLPLRRRGGEFLTSDPMNIRRLELAQRRYAGGHVEDAGRAFKDLLYGKRLDPLLGCVAGYGLVASGEPEAYRRKALRNMLGWFGDLPDSHVLAALCDPENADMHFANALERGMPVFAEGFRALSAWAAKDPERRVSPWVMPSLLLPGSPWTAWISARLVVDVKGSSFGGAPLGWPELEEEREEVESVLAGVGLVRRVGGPHPYSGTCFVVGPDLVATSEVVVADPPPDGFEVCFGEGEQSVFDVEQLLGVLPGGLDGCGVAVMRVASEAADGSPLPAPLRIAAAPPERPEGRKLYVAGFGGDQAEKRLQPGQLLGVSGADFHHDCYTVPGSAGSPVVDLEGGGVIGLHYAARWEPDKRGDAVVLWPLAAEPLLSGSSPRARRPTAAAGSRARR